MCDERSTSFIDHSGNIKAATHLNENKLQLNKLGKITFDWNICDFWSTMINIKLMIVIMIKT